MKKLLLIFLVSILSIIIELREGLGAEFCVSTVSEFEAALNQAATNGQDDTIKVVWGTYIRAFIFRSSEGKNITLKGGYTPGCSSRILDPASTIIDANFQYTPLTIHNLNSGNITVEGFTLRNGGYGGADLRTQTEDLYKSSGDITFERNIVTNNKWTTGAGTGGVIAWSLSENGPSGNISITYNIIINNVASGSFGGGIEASTISNHPGSSSGQIGISNNIIANNTGTKEGGGIYVKSYATYPGSIYIYFNTVTGNSASEKGGGIYIASDGYVEFYNNIAWGNIAPDGGDVYLSWSTNSNARRYHNNVGNWGGKSWADGRNNINSDPLFINPKMGDFRLHPGSPCIDAGYFLGVPPEDFEDDPRPIGTAVDIGADEYNLISHCVGNSTALQSALTAAQSNGKGDIIMVIQGIYNGNFIYNSNEGKGITIQGGYIPGCGNRILNPSNTILDGGGTGCVLSLQNTNGGNISVDGFTIRNGFSSAWGGGGLLAASSSNSASGNIKITNNIVTENILSNTSSWGTGGGIAADSYSGLSLSGIVTVANNIVKGNSAKKGGGIWARSASNSGKSGRVVIINNVINGNTASEDGGGVLANSNSYGGISGRVTLTNNTITANNATRYGGGLKIEIRDMGGGAYVYNNIVWGNSGPTGKDIYLDKDSKCTAYAYHNYVKYSGGSSWNSWTNNIDADPKFVYPAGSNYHLRPDSPCINTGNNNPPDGLPEKDFEGDARILNGIVDIGADEHKIKFKVDFDGDGRTDIAIYRSSIGAWYIIPSDSGTPYGVGWGGPSTDKPVPGDYDGDRKTDIAVYRTQIGAWYIIPSSNPGAPYGVGWGGDDSDKPVPGDYDGDGKTDIAIYRTINGGWYIIPSSNPTAPYGLGWGGNPTAKPVPGDYDGDGKTDIAVYRTQTGGWYIIPSTNPTAPYGVGWGGHNTDKPVPGDYDGDGKTDIAVYRAQFGAWYVIPSSNPSAPYGFGWGGDSTDKPVPGDYEGDGKTDIAVYRSSLGIWYIYPSGGSPFGLGWGGQSSDIPVTMNLIALE